jgi:aspartate 1-decarboxylase
LRGVQISLLKLKIHRAVVTAANVNCQGSLRISADLAELIELEEYERLLVGNMANGERFETYVIYRIRGHGGIELNGAPAHLGKAGDRLTMGRREDATLFMTLAASGAEPEAIQRNGRGLQGKRLRGLSAGSVFKTAEKPKSCFAEIS